VAQEEVEVLTPQELKRLKAMAFLCNSMGLTYLLLTLGRALFYPILVFFFNSSDVTKQNKQVFETNMIIGEDVHEQLSFLWLLQWLYFLHKVSLNTDVTRAPETEVNKKHES
jgi:hypothetical protein